MGLLNKIKKDVKNSGGSKGKFMYWRDGDKQRIRFLQEIDDGMDVTFYDSFTENVNIPDQTLYGRDMDAYQDIDLRERSQYIWSVWDYENKEVKLFMFPVNNFTPIPALMAMYENYGTLTDRDYVISQNGKGMSKSFSVIPMDKNKFRNDKAKPYSEQKVMDLLDKAWPADGVESNEDDFDVEESEYQEQKVTELYKLCVKREIEAEPRKPKAYYINLLEEYDNAQDDWGEDAEDWDELDDDAIVIEDDWGSLVEESERNVLAGKYLENTPVELFKLAKEKGLDVEPRKDKEYYVEVLVDLELAETKEEVKEEEPAVDLDKWEEDEWDDTEWE